MAHFFKISSHARDGLLHGASQRGHHDAGKRAFRGLRNGIKIW